MTDQWEGGKGDNRRPENASKFEAGYQAAFHPDAVEREWWRQRWLKLNKKDNNEPTTD